MKPLLRCLLSLLVIFAVDAQVPDFTKVSAFPFGSSTFINGTYGAGKFVAVSTNAVLYSTDAGTTWLEARNYPTLKYSAVLFGGDRFVAVGAGPRCAISDDGVNWSSVELPGTFNLRGLAYGNSTFAVAGDASGFSSDGRSWSFGGGAASAVVFANQKFLFDHDVTGVPTSVSYGGITWTGGFAGLAADADTFVRAAVYYSIRGVIGSLSSSSDGISWNGGVVGNTATKLYQVQDGYVRDDFASGGHVRLYLPDGSSASYPPSYGAFAWNKSIVLAFGTGGIWRYESGSWAQVPNPPEIRISSAAANGQLFVAVGSTNSAGVLTPKIIVATNGLPWTTQFDAPAGSSPLNAIRHADENFVAVGKGGTVIRSTDGINWSRRLSNTSSDLYDLAYGNGIWVQSVTPERLQRRQTHRSSACGFPERKSQFLASRTGQTSSSQLAKMV